MGEAVGFGPRFPALGLGLLLEIGPLRDQGFKPAAVACKFLTFLFKPLACLCFRSTHRIEIIDIRFQRRSLGLEFGNRCCQKQCGADCVLGTCGKRHQRFRRTLGMTGERHQKAGQLPSAAIEGVDLSFLLGFKSCQRLSVLNDGLLVQARRGGGLDQLTAKAVNFLLQRRFALG